jgi:hypothetical protein
VKKQPRSGIRLAVLPLSLEKGEYAMKKAYILQLGDFDDNVEALVMARRERKKGNLEEARFLLDRLREHIKKTGEMKSLYWLSPEIELEIYEIDALSRAKG